MPRLASSRSAAVAVFLCACNNNATDPTDGGFGGGGGVMTEPTESTTAPIDPTTTGQPGESSGGQPGTTETSADGTSTGDTAGETTTTTTTTTTDTTGIDCTPGYQGCVCLPDNKCGNGLECDPEVQMCVPLGSLCGDAIVGGAEECDNGVNNGDDTMCKLDCTLQVCGDGALGPGEACDDGNMVDEDECTNACKPAVCGDMAVQTNEECDDGNMSNTDACVACKAAVCGDKFIQAGVEGCDDGNQIDKDGCSATCMVELGVCGAQFSTGWCPQAGTKEQYTRCESVTNNNKTCNNPIIRYGVLEGGIPADHSGNNFNAWCVQLGFAGYAGQFTLGNRPCDAPQGRLFGCTGYDEGVWHWCDWQDGNWYSQTLDYHQCNDGTQITSITCQ